MPDTSSETLLVQLLAVAGGVLIALLPLLWLLRARRGNRGPSQVIAGAAIRYSDLGTLALPLPSDHEAIRRQVERQHGSRTGKHQGEAGFITNKGGFVGARDALIIARQAGQLRPVRLQGDELRLDYLLPPDQMPSPAKAGWGGARDVGALHKSSRSAQARQVASAGQLQRGFLRLALFLVPLLLAVLLAADLGAGHVRPGTVGALALHTTLYVLLGIAVAMVAHARGSGLRGAALAAGGLLLCLKLAWAAVQAAGLSVAAGALALSMLPLAAVTAILFARIRPVSGLLAATSLVWIFAAIGDSFGR